MPNPSTKDKLKVLFHCNGNSCRSQMAVGWVRAFKVNGIETHGLNPNAVKVMAEVGAMSAMRKFAAGVFDDATDMAGPCCADGKS